MARVIAGMTMSVDGFVADRSGSTDRLYTDLERLHGTEYMNAMIEATGAVIMGRKAFDMAEDPDWYVGNYEFQVPIFVVTHRPPRVAPKQDDHLTFTFVTELHVDVMPVLLGAGLRLFDDAALEGVHLEMTSAFGSGLLEQPPLRQQ